MCVVGGLVHFNFSSIQIKEIFVLRENIHFFLFEHVTYLKKVVGLVYFLVNTSSEKFIAICFHGSPFRFDRID